MCVFWGFEGGGFPLEVVDFLHINTIVKIFQQLKQKLLTKRSREDNFYEIFRVNEENQLS